MGDMLRSDPMTLCDIYIQVEAAYEIISCLGEEGCVQFHDMNEGLQTFQRKYIAEICRCAEMERKLRYMEDEMNKNKIPIPGLKTVPKAMEPTEQAALENVFEKWESDIMEWSKNQGNLLKSYLELSEMKYVLEFIWPMYGSAEFRRDSFLKGKNAELDPTSRLVIMTGLVHRQRAAPFETMLWRLSRGNVYFKLAEEDKIIKDPVTRVDVRKIAFLIVAQGEQLSNCMLKVCNGFRCHMYNCPIDEDDRNQQLSSLSTNILDLESVLKSTQYIRCKALHTVAKQWAAWLVEVRKAKAIYHAMNLLSLDITKNCLIGKCWVPTQDLPKVQEILRKCTEKIGTSVPSWMAKVQTDDVPPTFHRTNRFTNGFQALINAYGDSCYRELNPGLYTIITFPFLFSLMFGDVGHGVIMLSFAVWMLINEKKFMAKISYNEVWNILFGGRYLIFLMGLFSIYAGFLYNDFFSKGVNMQGSAWSYVPYTDEQLADHYYLNLEVRDYGATYLFGVDPAWKLGQNKIIFENSLKMKLSIVIGVIHMIFGLSLSLFNHLYFKREYLILLEFIPQFMFLTCLFLWLVILIFMKWFWYGGVTTVPKEGAVCAPMILILFIDMMLMSKSKAVDPNCDAYMFQQQEVLQKGLLLVGLLSVPVMLFGPPLAHMRINKNKKDQLMRDSLKMNLNDANNKTWFDKELEKVSEPFCDLVIYQAVHTIEFVLSTISHTASYLRLWALSLAHAQLSEMLWNMVFAKMALQDHSGMGSIKIVVVFAVWAVFSLAILVLMEGLSAFLHTLRLHWHHRIHQIKLTGYKCVNLMFLVILFALMGISYSALARYHYIKKKVEFMSKFYGGCGYLFKPFSFQYLLADQGKDKQEVCSGFKRRDAN